MGKAGRRRGLKEVGAAWLAAQTGRGATSQQKYRESSTGRGGEGAGWRRLIEREERAGLGRRRTVKRGGERVVECSVRVESGVRGSPRPGRPRLIPRVAGGADGVHWHPWALLVGLRRGAAGTPVGGRGVGGGARRGTRVGEAGRTDRGLGALGARRGRASGPAGRTGRGDGRGTGGRQRSRPRGRGAGGASRSRKRRQTGQFCDGSSAQGCCRLGGASSEGGAAGGAGTAGQ